MPHRKQFTAMIESPGIIQAPGVYDGLSAHLVQEAGFSAAFLSGACLAFSRFGRPDMGLVTATEVADAVAAIRERVSIPLIVDMDTGFGNAVNVGRTVKTFERAGATALQMEDQVLPKRCGHMAGKAVVSTEEMVGKIKAALDARQNDDTKIIARTDALGVLGFEEALKKGHAYKDAGADLLFIEAPKTVTQMREIGKAFGSDIPLVHNLVEGGGSPLEELDDIAALSYKVALYPAALLHGFVPVAERLLAHLKQQGQTVEMRETMVDLKYMNDLLGAPDLIKDAEKYGP
ncbi:isocitrate lyase/PEP mutase family protein [Temperatibacter marinus]|uniref:Isocitrate lyase/PEP mutase family protein n=1 Tax=Temperatibacter marinus TaxID=1456591 RepID=A0AA52EDM9_9PROT|nr:isocitrate lyase/PEP mutase family protein [Temperatibacter marinus]WND03542.1 isocitrate lyase/PEP mutase family protein [Temperatibacter marinus]